MDTQTSLRDALYDVIQPISGLTDQKVIWNHPEGLSPPQPNPPYITLGTSRLIRTSREVLGPLDNAGIRNVSQDFKWVVRINCYGPEALGILHSLAFEFNKESVIDNLQAAGFSFTAVTDVIRAPHLKDTAWEERAMFDLCLAFSDSDTDDIGFIESVGISGEYLRAEGDPDPIDSDISPIINI